MSNVMHSCACSGNFILFWIATTFCGLCRLFLLTSPSNTISKLSSILFFPLSLTCIHAERYVFDGWCESDNQFRVLPHTHNNNVTTEFYPATKNDTLLLHICVCLGKGRKRGEKTQNGADLRSSAFVLLLFTIPRIIQYILQTQDMVYPPYSTLFSSEYV